MKKLKHTFTLACGMVLALVLSVTIVDVGEAQAPTSALVYEPFDINPGTFLRGNGSGFGWKAGSTWGEGGTGRDDRGGQPGVSTGHVGENARR